MQRDFRDKTAYHVDQKTKLERQAFYDKLYRFVFEENKDVLIESRYRAVVLIHHKISEARNREKKS